MILDTCALLWLAQGGGRLSANALRRIASAPAVYVSAISGFEVGIKHRKGKLHLPAQPADWFETILEHHDIHPLPVDHHVALRSSQLPAVHSDPVDRIIVATAEQRGVAVVTGDSVFAQYGVEVVS